MMMFQKLFQWLLQKRNPLCSFLRVVIGVVGVCDSKEVFNLPDFKTWSDENVILVELDFPRRKRLPENIMKQNRELANVFAVRGYPTVWIVEPQIMENKVNFSENGYFRLCSWRS